jgi:hypothetical protein
MPDDSLKLKREKNNKLLANVSTVVPLSGPSNLAELSL